MKIALVCDSHFGNSGNSPVFLDQAERFFRNLFFPTLEKRGIKTIIHLGDVVDRRKGIDFMTLRRMKECFIEPLERGGYETHVIIGNHDIPLKCDNSINAMSELFDKTSIKYYTEPHTQDFDGTKILLMPWIHNENLDRCLKTMNTTPAQIMMGHLEILGATMMKGRRNEHGMEPKNFDRFELVLSGHFHTKSVMGNIQYLGSPYQLTWSDYADPRGFHIFDTETREVEFIKNEDELYFKVYYTDTDKTKEEILSHDFSKYEQRHVKLIKSEIDDAGLFDRYVAEMNNANPASLQIVEDKSQLDEIGDDHVVDEAEDTPTILSKYIDSMETNVPKKKLDTLMRAIYSEALHTVDED